MVLGIFVLRFKSKYEIKTVKIKENQIWYKNLI
jgi:hypothetical protein